MCVCAWGGGGAGAVIVIIDQHADAVFVRPLISG